MAVALVLPPVWPSAEVQTVYPLQLLAVFRTHLSLAQLVKVFNEL